MYGNMFNAFANRTALISSEIRNLVMAVAGSL